MRNLNLLFNKTYYDALTATSFDDRAVQKVNDLIFRSVFCHEKDFAPRAEMINHHFQLEVGYPGLLVGIGNAHSAGISSREIAAGFSFDYVTGQPCIPGSTVKGVLRSHFKNHPQAVMALTGKSEAAVGKLEAEIFDGGDIFFDAVVYDGDECGRLVGAEYITPHNPPSSSPTENPIPIQLIKVLSGVRFEFRFRLQDGEEMTAADKETLLRKLLLAFGIGAKTNVGFGILQPDAHNGAIPKKKPLPQEERPANQDRRQGEQRDRPQGQAHRPPATGSAQEGAKCPTCSRFNKRFNPNNGRENKNWTQGICFNCGGKLR